MSRIAAAPLIALAALAMQSGLPRGAHASEPMPARPVFDTAQSLPDLATTGLSSERVLSLVLALEALRAAPGALDRQKV